MCMWFHCFILYQFPLWRRNALKFMLSNARWIGEPGHQEVRKGRYISCIIAALYDTEGTVTWVPWASYQLRKIAGCTCAGNAGNIFPARLGRKPLVSDPGMHHGTCVTHVPWCMSGSLTRCGGDNVPGIPGACATRNITYLVRSPCRQNAQIRVSTVCSCLFSK